MGIIRDDREGVFRMMKRVFAMAMALLMMFALSAVALAEADVEPEVPTVEAEAPVAEEPEAPAEEPEVPAEEPEAPETEPSEDVDVPEELPEEEASSISRPRPTNPPKTSSSTSGKKPSSSAGQGTTTESGLTEIADGEVPLYGGMQTGDGTIYGAVALAMMSVLLLAGAVVCKVRG